MSKPQEQTDYIPLNTLNYLKFVDNPCMNRFVNNFNDGLLKGSFKNSLDASSLFLVHLRNSSVQQDGLDFPKFTKSVSDR